MTVLVPCRDAVADEIPASPARLARAATLADWRVRTTYARSVMAETSGPDRTFAHGDTAERRGTIATAS